MGRRSTRSREAWIAAAIEALGDGGPSAVRVERLARALGVTKGSFYWHFADRAALLEALLETWESAGTHAVIDLVEREGGDARARLRRLWELTSADERLGSELAIRDWARRDDSVAARVQRVDDARMGYLRSLLREHGADDVEARAMLIYSLLIGNYFIAARHGRRSRPRVLRDALALLL